MRFSTLRQNRRWVALATIVTLAAFSGAGVAVAKGGTAKPPRGAVSP